MKKLNLFGWFAWLKQFFGFGKKVEKKVITIDIETGGLYHKRTPIYETEAYKVDHKKHYDAMNGLLDKIEKSKIENHKIKNDGFDEKLHDLKKSVDRHYSRPTDVDLIQPSDSLLIPLIIDFEPCNEIISEEPTYESPREFDGGFGGGEYSGGGAGADYTSNSSLNDNSSSSYDSDSNSQSYDDNTTKSDW